MSFDIERARFGKMAGARPIVMPVFVCGLARAGTSIVTRLFAATDQFATPTYRDMPFPLAPNLYARLGGARRRVDAVERAHGDGLTHDLDSPEAIEEAFWRCFEGRRYLGADGLAPVPPQDESATLFRDYAALVQLARDRPRYLSKNNNNVLRLATLVETFADAVLVHPFRNPVAQAESLRSQHLRACALSAHDPFRRQYMDWLGHHEFGAGQRPFLFAGAPTGDRATIDYWLAAWCSVYSHLLSQPGPVQDRQVFVDYDRLCADPELVAGPLGARTGCPSLDLAIIRPGVRAADSVPSAAADIYRRLVERAQIGQR